MRAAYYDRKGSPEVLVVGDLAMPVPGPGEVRVAVHVSAINPSDTKQREGWGGQMAMPFPRIVPHNDGSGIIDDVGDGVAATRVGERVWIHGAQRDGRASGTAAEAVVVPSKNAIRLPDNASFEAGAGLGVPAMTAHRLLFADGGIGGQTILVAGGAGTVGRCAVQLAKWGGATVIATVGSPEQADVARAAGADHVFDYKHDNIALRVREIVGPEPAGVDRVAEVAFAANLALNLKILKVNGTIATFSSSQAAGETVSIPFYACVTGGVTVRFTLVYEMPDDARRQAIADITAALETGALTPVIAKRFPLERIAEAHAEVGTGGAGGKIVIDVALSPPVPGVRDFNAALNI